MECTHRVVREGWAKRFVNDCKHNWNVAKEIGGMVKSLFVPRTRNSRMRDAHAYFAAKAVPVAA